MSDSLPALRSYESVSRVYDLAARLWTGGAIGAASCAVSRRVRAGQRVLIAGVGGGRDAAALVRAGARLTLVDLSPSMLARAERRVAAVAPGAQVQAYCADALSLDLGSFDVVCAHYFLNLFGPRGAEQAFARLASCVAPGGMLSVADFTPVRRGHPLQALHYETPMRVFAALGLCARHPTYDYEQMAPAGWRLEATEGARVFGVGPRWHSSWFFRAPDTPG
ncbi:MAG: methyltransferase domain-containing protein [Deltaproteobacteria bacterium]|nr:methyltransferase domain-containing protein [Deltaproteobacteria bacterium]